MTTPTKNDAAPTGIGACVNDRNTSPHFTPKPATPPAHHNAPAGTSNVAAGRIAPVARTLRDRVYAFIASRGPDGATDDEGETALGIKPQTYTPRRGELAEARLIADSGRRRNTASGRPAAVWVLARFAPTAPTIAPEPPGAAAGPEGGAA